MEPNNPVREKNVNPFEMPNQQTVDEIGFATTIKVKGSFSSELVREANSSLSPKTSLRSTFEKVLTIGGFFLIVPLVLYFDYQSEIRFHSPFEAFLNVLKLRWWLFLGLISIIALRVWAIFTLRALRLSEKTQEQEFEFDKTELRIRNENGSMGIPWRLVNSFSFNETYMKIGLAPPHSGFVFLKKEWFSDIRDWERICQTLIPKPHMT